MKNVFVFLLIVGGLNACGQTKRTIVEKGENSVKVSVVDSLRFKNIIARLSLFQTVSEDYIFFRDVGNPRVMVFDRSGKLVYDWTKEGDDPGAFMMLTDNLVCTPNGDVITHDAMMGIKAFSPSGDLVFAKRSMIPPRGFHKLINLFRTSQVVEIKGGVYLLHHRDLMRDAVWGADFFKSRKNLLLTNLETGEESQILPFPEGSKFLNGKAFVFEDFRPVFFYEKKEQVLYLAFRNEDVLYEYDFSGEEPKLIQAYALTIPGFVGSEGADFEKLGYGKLKENNYAARILGLEKIGDNILISYTRSATPEELRELEGVMKKETRKRREEELWEKLKPETLLFRKGKVETYHVDMPKMAFNGFRVFDEELWFMKPPRGDVEEEDCTVYQGKLLLD